MTSPRRSILERLLFPSAAFSTEGLARSVAGKRVVITGASFGIGRAVALRLGAAGADMILIARSQDALGALVAEIEAAGGGATAIAADLIDAAVVEALAGDLATRGIDILISNAGKSIRRSLFDSLDRFHDVTRTIAVNYLGPVRLILALVPALRGRGGHILSISAANVLLHPPLAGARIRRRKTLRTSGCGPGSRTSVRRVQHWPLRIEAARAGQKSRKMATVANRACRSSRMLTQRGLGRGGRRAADAVARRRLPL